MTFIGIRPILCFHPVQRGSGYPDESVDAAPHRVLVIKGRLCYIIQALEALFPV